MEICTRLLELTNTNLIYCLPTMILTLVTFQLLFKVKWQFKKTYQIIKWIIIVYAVVCIIHFLIGVTVHPDQSSFLHRATGRYWLTYWIMLCSSTILPFSLLYKKMGLKPFYLLFVSVIMKIGWYFERYVLFIADYSSSLYSAEHESDWFDSPWSGLYLTWIQGIILALLLMVLTAVINRFENKMNIHNS